MSHLLRHLGFLWVAQPHPALHCVVTLCGCTFLGTENLRSVWEMKALAAERVMCPESGFFFQDLLPVLPFWLHLHVCTSAESSGVRWSRSRVTAAGGFGGLRTSSAYDIMACGGVVTFILVGVSLLGQLLSCYSPLCSLPSGKRSVAWMKPTSQYAHIRSAMSWSRTRTTGCRQAGSPGVTVRGSSLS